jgi:hypothetical protein
VYDANRTVSSNLILSANPVIILTNCPSKPIVRSMDEDTMKELAKAAQESAKLGRLLIESTEKTGRFFSKAFGKSIDFVAAIRADNTYLEFYLNRLKIIDQVEVTLIRRGVKNWKQIEPKFALPALEAAVLERSEEMQLGWVNLLANALDPNYKSSVRQSFIAILRDLEPQDAAILKFFWDQLHTSGMPPDASEILRYSMTREQISNKLGLSRYDYEVSMFNLFRSQLMAPAVFRMKGMLVGEERMTVYKGTDAVTITPLGLDFLRAVRTF